MPALFINELLMGISFGLIAKLAFPGVTSFSSGFNEQFIYRQIYPPVLVVLTSGSNLKYLTLSYLL